LYSRCEPAVGAYRSLTTSWIVEPVSFLTTFHEWFDALYAYVTANPFG